MSQFVNRRQATAEVNSAFRIFGIVEIRERELLKSKLVDFFMNHGRYDLDTVFHTIQDIKSRIAVL